jgi:phasin family protein
MYTPEQLIASQKESLDALLNLGHKSFTQIEKLLEHNLNTVKSTFEESGERLKEALSVKDIQELVTFNASLLQPALEKAVAYGRGLYQLGSEASAEVNKLTEESISKFNKSMATTVDSIAKNAPAGSESMVAFLKSSVSAANNAYDSLSKAAKQAAEAAEANINAAANATIKAASAATAAPKAAAAAKKAA